MKFKEYQKLALQSAIYPKDNAIIYPVLGLVGEAGEVAEKVKKILRDKGGIFSDTDKAEIVKELGDVLWYIAATCNDLGYSLAYCARLNTDKLSSRKERNVLQGSGDNR
jgi:NTP pyrophosphatase (non-canonical NTP hydrolase)